MSAKGISIGNFAGTGGTLDVDVSGLFGSKWGLFLTGDDGTGTFTIEGGDGVTYEAVKVTDIQQAGTHSAYSYVVPGLYTFHALCSHLRFILASATAADLDATLFPEARP